MIVTDAWTPQINGVARTYQWLSQILRKSCQLEMITPEGFAAVPMPTYPDIRLALASPAAISARIEAFTPDIVHIATEGPLGLLARRHCRRKQIAFTSCYHTRYPEYINSRFPLPLAWSYAALRRFHNRASATLTATPELARELRARGFTRTQHWRRGINVRLFAQGETRRFDAPPPYFLYAGRLAVEKNLPAFLSLDLPGTKIVAGEGPARASLEKEFPDVHFLGALDSAQLGAVYRAAHVFVFPSLTDTFGLVMAEALAAGTPVAAFPTSGARAILGCGENASGAMQIASCGVLNEDLRAAALRALDIPREACRLAGAQHSLEASADSFLKIIRAAALEAHTGKTAAAGRPYGHNGHQAA